MLRDKALLCFVEFFFFFFQQSNLYNISSFDWEKKKMLSYENLEPWTYLKKKKVTALTIYPN